MTNRYNLTLVIEEGDEYGEDDLWLETEIAAGVYLRIELPNAVEVYDAETRHRYFTHKSLKEAREILYLREIDKE